MREIKFRGQTYDTPPHWVFGDLYHYTTGEPAINYTHPHKKWLESEPVRPDTVGQFTGLKDATGKEIYEGDIVIRDNSYFQKTCPALPKTTIGAVEWRDGEFIVKGSYKLFPSSDKFPIRVIGNIYDNPNLLEAHA